MKRLYLYLSLRLRLPQLQKYVSKSGAALSMLKQSGADWLYTASTRYFATCISWGVLATGVVKIPLTLFGFDSGIYGRKYWFVLFMLLKVSH